MGKARVTLFVILVSVPGFHHFSSEDLTAELQSIWQENFGQEDEGTAEISDSDGFKAPKDWGPEIFLPLISLPTALVGIGRCALSSRTRAACLVRAAMFPGCQGWNPMSSSGFEPYRKRSKPGELCDAKPSHDSC